MRQSSAHPVNTRKALRTRFSAKCGKSSDSNPWRVATENDPGMMVQTMKAAVLSSILCFAFAIAAADLKVTGTSLFAVYPTVSGDKFEIQFAKPFEFERLLTSENKTVSGHYRPEPVIGLGDVKEVDIAAREIGAAPISGLRFRLKDSGRRRLNDYLSQKDARELVVFVDGYAYASLPLDTARGVRDNGVVFIVFPHPQDPSGYHFLELLQAKLAAAVEAQ